MMKLGNSNVIAKLLSWLESSISLNSLNVYIEISRITRRKRAFNSEVGTIMVSLLSFLIFHKINGLLFKFYLISTWIILYKE